MKGLSLCWGAVFASLIQSFGQVTVEVVFEQDQFLPGEAIPAAVRITNRSGQKLRLGAQPDWLTFALESRDNFIVNKSGEVPVLGVFELDSSQRGTKRVDLSPYFNVTRPGRYAVVATVRIKEWSTEVTSDPKGFDVIEGAKLWVREFGVPKPAGAAGQSPEVRKYILQQANHLRSQLRLYFRLTDASESKVLKVFPIGPMVSFGQPEPQVDGASNLHVLYQSGPRSSSYTVINPDGEILVRQAYEFTTTRPRLQADREGKIGVVGGVRRVTAADLPKPNDEIQTTKP
jgi:hypothetical protein